MGVITSVASPACYDLEGGGQHMLLFVAEAASVGLADRSDEHLHVHFEAHSV